MITYDIAKEYVNEGWSVIPVALTIDDTGKVQKKPTVAWREYQDRKATDEELHLWFDGGKINGIGLITGKVSQVVVVDEDTTSQTIPSTPIMSKTISGGHHYYFRWTEPMKNSVKLEGSPIDFRGDGGFVVIPPSGIGDQQYVWEKKIAAMFLHPLPADLKKKLVAPADKPRDTTFIEPENVLGVGIRNVTATQYAGYLIKHMDEALWDSVGFEEFSKWNDKYCSPPQGLDALVSTWRSIKMSEIRKRALKSETEETAGEVVNVYKGNEATKNYQDLMDKYGKGTETGFLALDNYFSFMPEQLYLLSSVTHQGKTTLAINIAARIAEMGHNVLFASLEQGIFIEPRVRSIIGGPVPEHLSILCSDQTVSVQTIIDFVEALAEKPKLIVVDHLHFIKKIKAEATEQIDDMIIRIQNMAKRLHIAVLVIAHVRKLNSDRPPELDDLRDSSSLSQVPSVVLLLYRKRAEGGGKYLEDKGILSIAKNRILGRTGTLNFVLEPSGKFMFKAF
jgi:hypothetical protein